MKRRINTSHVNIENMGVVINPKRKVKKVQKNISLFQYVTKKS